jgi:hypothetical protein
LSLAELNIYDYLTCERFFKVKFESLSERLRQSIILVLQTESRFGEVLVELPFPASLLCFFGNKSRLSLVGNCSDQSLVLSF